jgi:hypothetical protein
MSKSLVGPVVSGGGEPFWGERLERDPLPEDGTGAGRRDAEGGPGATGARGSLGASIRALVDETPDITLKEPRTALAAQHLCKLRRAVALPSPPQDHAQTRPRAASSRIVRTSWAQCRRGFLRNPRQTPPQTLSLQSVADLQATTNRFLDSHSAPCQPVEWVVDPDKIIAAVKPGNQVLDSIH